MLFGAGGAVAVEVCEMELGGGGGARGVLGGGGGGTAGFEDVGFDIS